MARLAKYAAMAEAIHSTATRKKPTVLVIAGTTAVGKTDLSLELAKVLNGEIISADSVQVYKRLDVGSAKVDESVCSRVPHHLLDVASIREQFSAGDYYKLAMLAIKDVISRGRVPLVVGGTGLYLRTLIHGPTGAPSSTPESRASMDRMLEGEAWETSLERLRALDPEYAASLLPNDWYRLKRALEICTLSGRSVTSFKKVGDLEGCLYEFKCLFLSMPRVQLFQRIDTRCEAIIEQGLFLEVISLVLEEGLVLDSQAGRSVGYRQALEYLSSVWGFPGGEVESGAYTAKVPRETMRKLFLEFLSIYQAKTRQLAHKQLVWFKKEPGFHWLNVAPGGQRLPLAALATGVAQWFTDNSPLPEEWDGRGLQELTAEEKHFLTEYSDKHCKLLVFSDIAKVESVLQQIEACLQGT